MANENFGRGAIMGALIGDAAGAVLEFLRRKPTPAEVAHALSMPGGGVLRVAPGQITDDGELTLSLMAAIAGSDHFQIDRVAAKYQAWLQSGPFDIGNTTRTGLGGAAGLSDEAIHEAMWSTAERFNGGSKANGALMRIAPLGVWAHQASEEETIAAACDDSRLTHPNSACQHSSAAYCIAIRHLTLNAHDFRGAFERATHWATELKNQEIQEWLNLAEGNVDVGYYPHAGFVKYGFVHAFRHLLRESTFEEAIAETLCGGGDTDTNACIVGGLIGAAVGEDAIPIHLQNALLKCDVSTGRPRPEFLQTRIVLPGLLSRMFC